MTLRNLLVRPQVRWLDPRPQDGEQRLRVAQWVRWVLARVPFVGREGA